MLDINQIHKTFNAGTVNEKVALDNINLTLSDGDFVTVIGGNGAGKSTMLNAIAGVWQPDSGNIIIDGTDITNMPDYKRAKFLGRVFQDPMMGTAANMLLEENLSLANRRGKSRGLRWSITSSERRKYREMLSELGLGLEDRLSTRMGLFSGGQRQAVTLLMASDKFIKENKLTALMVTHNMKDAIAHGNRLIMMNAGRIIFDVSGEEKQKLTVEMLLEQFSKASGAEFANDRALLG